MCRALLPPSERIEFVFPALSVGQPGMISLLVVVGTSDEPRFRRGQAAYAVIGPHVTPVDILVVTRDEFDRLLDVPSSLSATVLREGKSLYAA